MTIRTKLLGALCLTLLACLPVEAQAAPTPARSADDFVDSVGVNVHLHHQGTAYDTLFDDVIRPKLVGSGIRHLRDGAVTHAGAGPTFWYFQRCRMLADAGIRFNFTTTFRTVWQEATDLTKLDDIDRWCNGAVESFEGVNEPDIQPLPEGSDWVTQTIAHQQALYEAVEGSEQIADRPVVGPSVVYWPEGVGDLSPYLDHGNWHPYPGGKCPTCADVYGQTMENTYLPRYRLPSGDKPMVMTETGYHNAINMPFGWAIHRPASEVAAGKYVPRLLLEYFNRGFVRTYLYELIDAWPDPAREHPDANFGLLRNDGTEKPAFRSLRSLLRLLRDPGPEFEPAALDYELSGELDDVHHTLLQKRDGRFFLALWQERSSYDTGERAHADDDVAARGDLVVPAQRVTIRFAQAPAAARIHRIGALGGLSSTEATLDEGGSLTLAVPDRVTIVELGPAPTTPAPSR